MVRAPRYGYQRPYNSSSNAWRPLWQEGERLDKWNPFYRQDLTGEDEEISLEDVEGGKPPTYVPSIDQQPLGYKDVLGPRKHPWEASTESPGGYMPSGGYLTEPEAGRRMRGDPYIEWNRGFQGPDPRRRQNPIDYYPDLPADDPTLPMSSLDGQQTPQETIGTHGGPYDLIAPPDKPQQDTQSVAAIFGSPQSGASSMAEDPRQKAARIAREAFGRDPSLIKEFMPKLQAVGVDPALGAPKGWSLPDTGTLTADDMAAPFMSSRPVGGQAQPLPPEPTDPWAAADADWRDWERRRDASMAPVRGPASPIDAGYDFRPRQSLGDRPDLVNSAGIGRPTATSAQGAGLQAAADMGAFPPISAPIPRPRPMDSLIAGRPDAPLGGMPAAPQFAGNMPRPRPEMGPQFAGNMPRPRPEDAGMATARLPQPRPDMPGDVAALSPDQRLAPFTGPAPPVSPELSAAAGRATQPTDPFLTGLPSLGAIDQTVQQAPVPASPIDPAAIEEARRTLQMHPDTGRIRTAPGFTQFNEPARLPPTAEQAARPLIRPDLTQAAANYTPARLPRARPTPPPIEAMGSDLPEAPPIPGAGSLPASVTENIARAGYDPRASGGPAAPTTPEEETARQALIKKLGRSPETVPGYADPAEGLIAGPEVGAINAGQPLPPPPEATAPPPITEQQTIDDRPPLIASSQDYANYAGPTAKSRRTGFLGNVFDREHFVGGPGLTRPIGEVTDYTKSAKPGRGKYKPAEHERLARNIGKTAGLVTSAVTGAPLTATMPLFGMGGAMINRAIDPNRQVIERGPLRFFGGIFGRGKDKNKNKNNDPAGIKEAAAAKEAIAKEAARSGGSGLGSDRGYGGFGGYGYGGGYYGGGSYPGYGGYGGGYGPDSTGGAYRNR